MQTAHNPKAVLKKLHENLNILQEQQAKYAGNEPPDLTNQISDHQAAIDLTEQVIDSELSEAEWHEAMRPLLVNVWERRSDIAGINISDIENSVLTIEGDVTSNVHAGGDVVGGDKVTQTAEGDYNAQAGPGGHAEVNTSTFDQRGQQVDGDQYNADGNINIHQTPEEPPFWRRLSRANLILALIFGLIATSAVVLAIPGVSDIVYGVFTPAPFTPASDDETLIVIATFHVPEGVPNTEPHTKIRRAIEAAAAEVGLDTLRVEEEPTILKADEREAAEALGNRYQADMIIWGEDTGVEVIVTYLNLKEPDYDAAEVKISETERTQIANPPAYNRFIVNDLPAQLTFLSLFAVGQSYITQKKYNEAIRVIEKAVALLPSEMNLTEGVDIAYFNLGWLYGRLEDANLEQAKLNYDKGIELNPGDYKAYNNRGIVYKNLGEYEQALADYDKAIELNPEYAFAYNNRGNTYSSLEEYEQAIADYDKAIELNPEYAFAYNNRGATYKNLGEYGQAIVDYDKAIELNPDFAGAYSNRGLTYDNLGEYEQAIADYTKAIELNPDADDAYISRGNTYGARGEYEQAIVDYNKAIELNPDLADAYYNRGLTYDNLGEYEQAIADYDKAIELNPDLAAAYNNRGIIYYDLGEYKQAIANYDKAIELNPDLAAAYNNRGLTYKDQGDYEQAIADYDKAIELNPDYTVAYNDRGIIYYDLGDYKQAIANYDKAIELNPDFALAYNNRGLIYKDQGDYKQAIANYDKAIELNPDFALAYNNRGLIYYNLGEYEHAIADFKQYLKLAPTAPDKEAVINAIEEMQSKLDQ